MFSFERNQEIALDQENRATPLESVKGRYGKLSVEPLENQYNYRVDIGWVTFGTEVPKYRIPYPRPSAFIRGSFLFRARPR